MKPKKKTSHEVVLPTSKEIDERHMCTVTGSKIDDFTHQVCNQAIQTLWVGNSTEKQIDSQINAAMAGMLGVKPQDEVEGMLAAQMVAAHNAAMECYRRSMNREQSFDGREMNLNQANKLSRTYASMMEALSRYRGKGQQKVIVEHVHVHAGGQAIVGNVTRREGGIATKSEDQAHAQEITHAPMPEMFSPNTAREAMPVASDA